LVALFGSVLAVAAIWTLVRFTFGGRTNAGGRPFALSLLFFGLLFSAVIARGRSGYSEVGSNSEYRYTVFVIFVLVGLYLAVLDAPTCADLETPWRPLAIRRTAGQRPTSSGPVFILARIVVGIGIVLTVLFGTTNGISMARATDQGETQAARVMVRADQYPDTVVQSLSIFELPQQIRRQVATARRDHLSLFGTGDAASYLSEKPIQYRFVPLRAAVFLPRNGSTVHGRQTLDVLGTGSYDVTRVDFFLSGPGLARALVVAGAMSNYGWFTVWNTGAVPNGMYTIEAKVRDSAGRSVVTTAVEVLVDNVQATPRARPH
jgi:hypothetical protein